MNNRICPPQRRRPTFLTALCLLLAIAGCETTTSVELTNDREGYIPGDLYLLTQADVDTMAGLVEVEGTLQIGNWSSGSIHDLRPLTSLRRVGENLNIYGGVILSSLTGLEHLSEVGETIYIRMDLPLTGFRALNGVSCEKLKISFNDSLISLDGLPDGIHTSWLELSGNNNLLRFNGIGTVAGLRNLTISNCERLRSLEGLENLPELVGLSVYSCDSLLSPGGMTDLPALTRLSLRYNPMLSNISGLAGFAGLRILDISGSSNLSSLAGLAGVTNLDSLTLSSANLTSLQSLPALPGLRVLQVGSSPCLVDLSGLSTLEDLEVLRISYNNNLIDCTGISGLPQLQSLRIFDCDSLLRLDGLADLPRLTDLHITHNDLESINGLQNCPGLQHLSLGGDWYCEMYELDSYAPLKELVELVSLSLSNLSGPANLPSLENLDKLESLSLRSLPLVSLAGLSGLDNLKHVDIRGLDKLVDLQGLALNSEAESVFLYYNDHLASLDGLENLSRISNRLLLHGNDALTDISALSNLASVGVGGISIQYNDALDNCVAAALADNIICEGPVEVVNNGECR